MAWRKSHVQVMSHPPYGGRSLGAKRKARAAQGWFDSNCLHHRGMPGKKPPYKSDEKCNGKAFRPNHRLAYSFTQSLVRFSETTVCVVKLSNTPCA